MQSPDSKTLSHVDPIVAPSADFRVRWWLRVPLFVLHVVVVAAAMSLTPSAYFFQLGYHTGSVLLLSSIFLWCLLFSAKTRKGIWLYCLFALLQIGLMALLGLHLQAEDRALQSIMNEFVMKQAAWMSQMEQFRMDPLFEMISGKRQLSVEELRELQARAHAAKGKLDEIQADAMRTVAEAESRIAAVSSGAARDFRSGVESTRSESDQRMKLTQHYFGQVEQLTRFLIDCQGRYSQTAHGLVFKRDQDAKAFDQQVETITQLQQQLNSPRQSLEPH